MAAPSVRFLIFVALCARSAESMAFKHGTKGITGLSRAQLLKIMPLALLPALRLEAWADQKMEYMPAISGKDYGKPRTVYPDFQLFESGLQVKDVKVGNGDKPRPGDRVVIDWSGYTIGYYGRIFEAAGKVQGGAFANEKSLFRFVLGSKAVIPALDQAVAEMRVGGVRQIVIPPELGYPPSDPAHDKVGPKPSTFSGQRALDFVLQNQGLIDKTLLMNVELKRVDKPGERGFS